MAENTNIDRVAAAKARPAAAATLPAGPTAQQLALQQYEPGVIAALKSGDYTTAWKDALASESAYGGSQNVGAGATDPLVAALESSRGLKALDPTINMTPDQIKQYYDAFAKQTGTYAHGAGGTGFNGNLVGKNPYGQWGTAADTMAGVDAQAKVNAQNEPGVADVSNYLGARADHSFLAKYGGTIASVVGDVAGSFIGDPLLGNQLVAAYDATQGDWKGALTNIASSVLPGAADLGGFLNGATDGALGATASTALGGAGLGALESAVTGGNVLTGALTGGLGGAVQGSGITGALGKELGGGVVGNGLAGGLVGAGAGAVGSAITGKNVAQGAEVGGISGAIQGGIKGSGATGSTAIAEGIAGSALTGLAKSTLTSPSGSSSGGSGGSVAGTPPIGQQDTAATPPTKSGVGTPSDLLSGLGTGLGSSLGLGDGTSLLGGLGTTLGQVAPYAAVGALGMKQAADGRANDQKYVNQLTSLGQPMVDQSNKLLQNYNSNTLNPQDSALLKQANTLASQINSNSSGLSDIAKTAFANYASGKLSPGDQATLDAQVASQKQQVASQLASAGITDSTILAGQYAQIDNQALITKQSLLNAQFATGNQAYDSYLTGTNEGQAILTTATQTADTSLQNELNSAVSTFGAGANVITTGIQTAMAADANYSKQVSDLLGTLASAYAKQYMSGSGSGAGGSAGNAAAKGAAGAAGGQLGNLAIKAANGNAGLDSNLVTGGGQSPATSADTGAINADIGASTPDLSLSDFNNQSNFNDWTSNLTVPDVSLPDGGPP